MSTHTERRLIRLGLLAAWAHSLLAAPQQSLTGRVLDSANLPIAGARIVATGPGGFQASALTDSNGIFVLQLEAGDYGVVVTKKSFNEERLAVHTGATPVQLDAIVLRVEPIHNTVQVSGETGYLAPEIESATRTSTPLVNVPQSVSIVTRQQAQDQLMLGLSDVVRYVPGVSAHQGENNRDEIIIRGNDSSSSFFVDGMRDDVQYYRDLYNVDRTELLKGPNALSFGRGGGGGVLNRVTKEAGFTPLYEVAVEGGSFGNKRVTADIDRPWSSRWATRINGVYENSDSFRKFVGLERYGLNPTLTFAPSERTTIQLGFETFRDYRTADRGISSFAGSPVHVPADTYYGNPADSYARALVNDGSLLFERRSRHLLVRNRSLFGNYNRGYQNYVPGTVNASQSLVTLSAYNNATDRTNLLNQTDVVVTGKTGILSHTLLAGFDLGHQSTANVRNTGFFNGTDPATQVVFADPLTTAPVIFRQSATDADNHVRTDTAAGYIQDQVELSRFVQVLGGLRYDRFELDYKNKRNGQQLDRSDKLWSPRAALLLKPASSISLYLSYSVTYLPSSGDQFSSLTNVTQQLKPEKFSNYEAGIKWNAHRLLSVTTAIYRLDRTNTRSLDPNDSTRIVQTGSQRTKGYEAEVTGKLSAAWAITGGYAYQDALVTSATASAAAGAQVGQTPHHMFSLWNRYQILPRLSFGLGLLNRSRMFAAIDDAVTIPGYFRADAALFYSFTERIRLQANVENLLDRSYIANADSNTNLSPGSPRAIRLALVAHF